MAEIQKVTMWAYKDRLGDVVYADLRFSRKEHEAGTGWIVPVEVIVNTLENIEAIKKAARAAITAHHKAKRAEGMLWKDIDDVDAILWPLGLTGGGE